MPPTPNPNVGSGPGRFIGAVFGFVFLGIGVTVIGFLWSAPSGEFGSPPLVFRIFGSFIALAFVAMGGGIAYAAIFGKMPNQSHGDQRLSNADSESISRGGYSCDNCGAGLDSSAEVSPRGDVKCAHCGRWFNVHAS
jgi:DNA-directed RNA polymerase subunit RPC12/RpoP